MKPLIFSPSPRNIPAVLELWEGLKYDHLIEKYRQPLTAYQNAKRLFLEHDYTHLVVCPDDLEVTNQAIEQLIEDVKTYDYPVISGMCNVDESQPTTYNIQRVGCDYTVNHPAVHKGAWYEIGDLPNEDIFEVGFSGFPCEMIARDVMEQVSFKGSSNDNSSNMDWQFTGECNKLGIKIMVDKRVNLYHRRMEQYAEAKAFKSGKTHRDDGASLISFNSKN